MATLQLDLDGESLANRWSIKWAISTGEEEPTCAISMVLIVDMTDTPDDNDEFDRFDIISIQATSKGAFDEQTIARVFYQKALFPSSWTGGSPDYFLSLVPAGQSAAAPIKQFPTQSGTAFTWTTDLAAGTSFTIALKDSTGTQVFSDIVTIQNGSSTSCINTSITESGGTAGTAASTSGSSSGSGSVPAATTSAGSSSAAAASGTASSTGSAASSSSTSKPNGAPSNRGSALAVAGVMGLVGAVLF
ncbi:hypothetical protein JB92DRAFT_3118677 [Gautieria morchelliformis]|nr:hypothetical protein JB92DRAFT_3118677 [Gautieria morchelliformis]